MTPGRPSVPLRVFLGLLMAYVVYDYAEHVTRPASWFAANPWPWLGFTVTVALAMLLVILGARWGIARVTGRTGFLAEAVAVGVGPVVHVYLTGPLADGIFGSARPLIFHSPWPLVALFVVIFALITAVAALIRRWTASRSDDR